MASSWSQRFKDNRVTDKTLRQKAEADCSTCASTRRKRVTELRQATVDDVSTPETKRRKQINEQLARVTAAVADAHSKLDALAVSMHAHYRSTAANEAAQQVLAMLEDPPHR